LIKYIIYQLIAIYPITPHFSEVIWRDHLAKTEGVKLPSEITVHKWPVIHKKDIDFKTLDTHDYVQKFKKQLRMKITK